MIVFQDWINGTQVETITKLALIAEHAQWAASPTGTTHVSEMTPDLTLTSFNLNMSLAQKRDICRRFQLEDRYICIHIDI